MDLRLVLPCSQGPEAWWVQALSRSFAGWMPMLLIHTALIYHLTAQQALNRKWCLLLITGNLQTERSNPSTFLFMGEYVCVENSEGGRREKDQAKCTSHHLWCHKMTPSPDGNPTSTAGICVLTDRALGDNS